MKFVAFDNGTYLVRSRTRAGHHVVDINEMTCSCEGFQFYLTCDHLRAALRRFGRVQCVDKIVTVDLTQFL